MWQEQMLDYAESAARRFNNPRVFERVVVHSREYTDPLSYLPVREYCARRFVRHIEIIGPERLPEILGSSLVGTSTAFTGETKALAFLIGLRETGLPMILQDQAPGRDRYFMTRGNRYIRNFGGSGLDHVGSSHIQRGLANFLEGGMLNQIFVDDPDSTDDRDIGIRQSYMFTVFVAYLRYQHDFYLQHELQGINNRLIRFFWRALTFGGQGGSDWSESRAGGRHSLLTLMELLHLQTAEVPSLWDRLSTDSRVGAISDINTLRQLARRASDHRRPSDVSYWQNQAKTEIARGLRTPRYFQAMKLAAIAEGFMSCGWDTGIPLNPY